MISEALAVIAELLTLRIGRKKKHAEVEAELLQEYEKRKALKQPAVLATPEKKEPIQLPETTRGK